MTMYKLTNTQVVIRLLDNACIPADSGNIDYQQYLAWVAEGNAPEPADAPTPEQITAQYESALDAHLDAVAKLHRYDSRFTFAIRAGYSGPYQTEGAAFAQWMDTCNAQSYALLQSVLAGQSQMPTIESFIGGLPVFVKP